MGRATSGTYRAGWSRGTDEHARALLPRAGVSSGVERQSLRRTPIDHKQTNFIMLPAAVYICFANDIRCALSRQPYLKDTAPKRGPWLAAAPTEVLLRVVVFVGNRIQ